MTKGKMEKAPRDKMIKGSPKKKEEKQKKEEDKDERETAEQPEELSAGDKKEIQVIERVIEKEVAPSEAFQNLSRPQIDLMKRTVAVGATDDELKMFLQVCVGAKLNPFLRQVHFVKRWNSKEGKEVGSIQVGIDGFRAIAESGGQYAGSDDAIFTDEKEVLIDKVKKMIPEKATVTVHKLMEGNRYPFTATARWGEYYPGEKQGYMWHKMPYGQLAKCAEALALRKAFPKLLSGLYAPEEMDQATEAKEENVVEKVLNIIEKSTDLMGLIAVKEKIKESKKYTKEEKEIVINALDNKLKQFEVNEPEKEAKQEPLKPGYMKETIQEENIPEDAEIIE